MLGPAKMRKKTQSMRAPRDSPQLSLARKRGSTASGSVVLVSCTSVLRRPGRRILAEQARSATATVGTSRLGRVVIRGLAESLFGRFRRVAERVGEACDLERLGIVGPPRQDQVQPGAKGLLTLRGVPEPVVSDLVKTSRQDVLEEAGRE
jgi:hypothetical protein